MNIVVPNIKDNSFCTTMIFVKLYLDKLVKQFQPFVDNSPKNIFALNVSKNKKSWLLFIPKINN